MRSLPTKWIVSTVVVLILATVFWPVIAETKQKAKLTTCIENMRQILSAAKMYEADYGEVIVHMGRKPGEPWTERIMPYLKSPNYLICPNDETRGKDYYWGGKYFSSYIWFYTIVHIGKGNAYKEVQPDSVLVGCTTHANYQIVLGRYNGIIELPPWRMYPKIKVSLKETTQR